MIAVIGLGKLGLCTAACFATKYKVIGIDTNESIVDRVNAKCCPMNEPRLSSLIKTGDLTASIDYEDINGAELAFIVVPTPSVNGEFSNEYLFKVVNRLKLLKKIPTVVIVSTVMPGTTYKVKEMLGTEVIYNPEFIALGSVIDDFLNPDFILIGGNSDKLIPIYKKICAHEPQFAVMSPLNAEIAKMALNCYVTMKISFANSISQICDRVGANAKDVLKIGLDSRIGTKYLSPGLGFGGPCFPRDNIAFSSFVKKAGLEPIMFEATQKVNKEQVKRIIDTVKTYNPKTIGILGFSYKPNSYITEESQALEIAKKLSKEYKVLTYDPQAVCEFDAKSMKECINESDLILILTPWNEFKGLRIKKPVIDCWGIL